MEWGSSLLNVCDKIIHLPWVIVQRNGVAHRVPDHLNKIFYGDVEYFLGLAQHEIIVGVSVDDGFRNPLNGAGYGFARPLRRLRLNSIAVHELDIGFFTFLHAISHGDDGILFNIDHGVHFDKTGIILQRHEIRGFVRDVEEERERGLISQMLDLALGGVHCRIFFCAGDDVIPRLHRALIHQNETDDGLIPADGGDTGINPYVIVQGDVIVSLRCLETVLMPEYAVEKAVLQGSVVIV